MHLAPLLAAPLLVQLHAFAALGAMLLGLVQFAAPKGTLPHRRLGWVWVALMAAIALSSFGIMSRGHWSWIHLISLATLAMLVQAVRLARRGRIGGHRNVMLGLFLGALLVTGAFTLLPGRIMGAVVFGW
jgi:uncharacterized membrane protein